MVINSTTIPAWVVSLFMLYTAWIWFVCRKREIRMDSRIFSLTLVLEALVYGIVFQFYGVDLETRGFYSRLMMIMICFSQAFPLTVSYARSRYRGQQQPK